MKTESTSAIMHRIARGMTILVLTLLSPGSLWSTTPDTVAMGSGIPSSPSLASAAPIPSDVSQRYIIFLSGINSSSSEKKPLENKFEKIKNSLEKELGIHRFVYFSYSAMNHAPGQVPHYCQGWGTDNCSDELDLIDLFDSPVYAKGDTQQSIVEQANALIWLIDQIVEQDESAQIDLVGFSLGGIVASYWAAHAGSTSPHRDHIHSIVLLESPVGGIFGARAILDNRFEGIALALYLRQLFGTNILRALQVPEEGVDGSIVASLEDAARFFNVTSIQSKTDFFVNRNAIVIGSLGPVPIGLGSQYWTVDHTRHHNQNLGGQEGETVSTLQFKNRLQNNHSDPLSHPLTAQWVIEAVREGSVEAVPEGSDILFITELPEFPVLDPQTETEITLTMQNISGETWEAGDYSLVNIGDQDLSPKSQIAMDVDVPPGHSVQWKIPVMAPAIPGVYRTVWQFSYKGVLGGPPIWADLIVVPPGSSGEFRATIQRLIDQALQSAREKFEEEWAKIRQQIIELIEAEVRRIIREAINEICPCGGAVVGLPLLLAALLSGHRRRSNGSEVPDDNE